MHRTTAALLPLAAGFALTAAALWGPPRITVTEVKGTPSVPGAVLMVEAHHHTDEAKPDVSARAIGVRGTERVNRAITLTPTGDVTRYGVTKQWENGMAWVVIFTIKQGDHAQYDTAESMVKIDPRGVVTGIVTPGAENDRNDRYPRALREKEIEDALSGLRAGSAK